MSIKTFKDLLAWQKGHELVLLVYKQTTLFPKEELFGLTNQTRRSVVSITSNVAEGFSRKTVKDKSHFYHMAKGSLTELENQFIVARDLQYIPTEEFEAFINQYTEVSKLLTGLIKYLKAN